MFEELTGQRNLSFVCPSSEESKQNLSLRCKLKSKDLFIQPSLPPGISSLLITMSFYLYAESGLAHERFISCFQGDRKEHPSVPSNIEISYKRNNQYAIGTFWGSLLLVPTNR